MYKKNIPHNKYPEEKIISSHKFTPYVGIIGAGRGGV